MALDLYLDLFFQTNFPGTSEKTRTFASITENPNEENLELLRSAKKILRRNVLNTTEKSSDDRLAKNMLETVREAKNLMEVELFHLSLLTPEKRIVCIRCETDAGLYFTQCCSAWCSDELVSCGPCKISGEAFCFGCR